MVVPRFAKLKLLLPVGAGLLVLTGLALAFVPGQQVATTFHPQKTSSSSPSPSHSSSPSSSPRTSSAPSSSPTVAGISTAAPTANNNAAKPTQPGQENYEPHISLVIKISGKSSTYSVRLLPGANPCTVLNEARQEGWISSVTILDDSNTSLKSLFVSQINGIGSWEYTVKNGSPPGGNLEGCTYPNSIQPIDGSTVTWTHS